MFHSTLNRAPMIVRTVEVAFNRAGARAYSTVTLTRARGSTVTARVPYSNYGRSCVGSAVCGVVHSLNSVKYAAMPHTYTPGHARQYSSGAKLSREECVALLRKADAVCFDVDSTVSPDEGIDVLAEHCGAGQAVAEWTAKAMNGGVTFQEALKARLELIRPSKDDVENCLLQHPPRFTPGADHFIRELEAQGTDVYLLSGGFRQMIAPLLQELGLPKDRLYANSILFNADGSPHASMFDDQEPTSRSGGKARVVDKLKNEKNYDVVIMIGDGATDMEAKPPATAFIGFGGIAVRDAVKDGADWFVLNFDELRDAIAKTN
eukprot:GFYU01013098.1.p1 GENE.GFYU01013098.1~~GFYU01013098.1.p1  ORF type:complete len:320 (-),score=92.68 GFYU01013098.1:236-1195(-)